MNQTGTTNNSVQMQDFPQGKNVNYPWFLILGIAFFFLAIPAGYISAVLASWWYSPGDLYGYGAAAIGFMAIFLFIFTGTVLSVVSRFKHEQPRWLSMFSLIINGLGLLYLVIEYLFFTY